MDAKTIRLRIADNARYLPLDAWLKAPTYKLVRGRVINARWAAHTDGHPKQWAVTHRATGFSGGVVASFALAQQLVRAFEKAYPVKRWIFTDPRKATGMKKAGALRRQYEAMNGR